MDCAEARPLISRRLDGALSSRQARALTAHLDACAACRSYDVAFDAEQRSLSALWPAVSAPPGFAARVSAALPRTALPRARPLWRVPAATAAALLIVVALALTIEPVRAGLSQALRTVALRNDAPAEPERLLPRTERDLAEARLLVPWRIRTPHELPEGYRLIAVTADAVYTFADGPAIVIEYQRGDGPDAPSLRVTQVRVVGLAPVSAPSAAVRTVRFGNRDALLIDGEWVERDGARTWLRGNLLRLIVEDDDILLQLEADPRAGWDEHHLIAVARSLR